MPIHLIFSCFTFSFKLLTHQTDPYRHKPHVSKKRLKSRNRYLIYKKKSVINFLLVVVVVQFRQVYLKNRLRYGDETLHKVMPNNIPLLLHTMHVNAVKKGKVTSK